MRLYQVTLFPEVSSRFPYLLDGMAEIHTIRPGEVVVHITATKVDVSGPYLSMDVSSPTTGETVSVLLNHSFVAAIIDLTNHKSQLGFVDQSKTHE